MNLRVSTCRPELHASPTNPTRCRQTSTSRTGGSSSSVKWRTATHDSNNIANPSRDGGSQSDPREQQSSRVRINSGASPRSGLDSVHHFSRELYSSDRSSSTGLSSTFSLFEDVLSVCTTPTDISLAFGPEAIEAAARTGKLGSSAHVFSGRPLYSMQYSRSRATPPPPAITLAPAVMSAEPSAPQRPPPEDKRKADDFYVNVGDAIRTLRRELPNIFSEDLSYNIYREDIVFKDPRNTFMGIDKYKLIFRTLRFFGQVFFQPHTLRLEILRIWQPQENKIVVRWCVKGQPRVPWQTEGNFDATSEFKLDRHGKIYEHKVNNITTSPDNYLSLFNRMLSVTVAKNQAPTPSFFRPQPIHKTPKQQALENASCVNTREVCTSL